MSEPIDRDEFERLLRCRQDARAIMDRLLPLSIDVTDAADRANWVPWSREIAAEYEAAKKRHDDCERRLRVMLGGVG